MSLAHMTRAAALIAGLCVVWACSPATSQKALKDPSEKTGSSAQLTMGMPGGKLAQARLHRSVELIDAGELGRAIDVLEGLRREFPNNGMVLHELALAYRMERRPKEAVAVLEPFAAQLGPRGLSALASAYDEAGDAVRARGVLLSAIRRYPDEGVLYSDLGTTSRGQGENARALSEYLEGVERAPAWPANYYHVAGMYAASGQVPKALYYGGVYRTLSPERKQRGAQMANDMVYLYKNVLSVTSVEGGDIEVKLNITVASADDASPQSFTTMYMKALAPALAVAHVKGISLRTLHETRKSFLEQWQESGAIGRPFEFQITMMR